MNVEGFAAHRGRLLGLAYRMLGSVASAEDVVQETWVRWNQAEDVANPAAWLTTVCTRLCLDELKSARVRREEYVGPWLPEPWVTSEPVGGAVGESLTTAFLLLLERLPPTQRGAWLLREVFEVDYPRISEVLQTSEATCRQWVRRARKAIDEGRPKFDADPETHVQIVAAFGEACATGDVARLESILANEVVLTGDGGGLRTATRRPVVGANNVARFLVGVWSKLPSGFELRPGFINNTAGAVVWIPGVGPYATVCVEVSDGKVVGVRNVLNPNKLKHLEE